RIRARKLLPTFEFGELDETWVVQYRLATTEPRAECPGAPQHRFYATRSARGQPAAGSEPLAQARGTIAQRGAHERTGERDPLLVGASVHHRDGRAVAQEHPLRIPSHTIVHRDLRRRGCPSVDNLCRDAAPGNVHSPFRMRWRR